MATRLLAGDLADDAEATRAQDLLQLVQLVKLDDAGELDAGFGGLVAGERLVAQVEHQVIQRLHFEELSYLLLQVLRVFHLLIRFLISI